jgi:5-formyltetrahydrofolate cyclo-ligase
MIEPGSAAEDPVRRAKRELRRQILAARATLPASERTRLSAAIAQRVLELPQLQHASQILGYLSFGHELETDGLLRSLLASGVRLLLPRIDRTAHRLDLYRVEHLDQDTIPGVWGIREPDPERCAPALVGEANVILVPGVAFTPRGARLGYGGGYYDELLSRSDSLPALIAPAFDLQVVDSVPSTSRDHPVDLVVTQSALYRR